MATANNNTSGVTLSDRQLKLRNYHARKVAEKQQLLPRSAVNNNKDNKSAAVMGGKAVEERDENNKVNTTIATAQAVPSKNNNKSHIGRSRYLKSVSSTVHIRTTASTSTKAALVTAAGPMSLGYPTINNKSSEDKRGVDDLKTVPPIHHRTNSRKLPPSSSKEEEEQAATKGPVINKKDDAMKALFAARRRKAQLEMNNVNINMTLMNSSVTSNSTNVSLASEIEVEDSSLTSTVIGDETPVAVGGGGSTATRGSGPGQEQTIDNSVKSSTRSSRKALDRYLGKSRSSARGATSSAAASASSASIGGGSTISGITQDTYEEEEELEEETSTIRTSVGSMDSVNVTHQEDVVLTTHPLSPVREESSGTIPSMSSIGTTLIDNTTISSKQHKQNDDVQSSDGEEEVANSEDSRVALMNMLASRQAPPTIAEDDEPKPIKKYVVEESNLDPRAALMKVLASRQAVPVITAAKTDNDDSCSSANKDNSSRSQQQQQEEKNESVACPQEEEVASPTENKRSVTFDKSPLEKVLRLEERKLRKQQEGQAKEQAQCSPPRLSSLSSRSLSDKEQQHDEDEGMERKATVDQRGRDDLEGMSTKENHDLGTSDDVAMSNMPRAVPVVDILQVVEVEDDVEFTKFVAGLRREVSGDHTEVSSSIYNVFVSV